MDAAKVGIIVASVLFFVWLIKGPVGPYARALTAKRNGGSNRTLIPSMIIGVALFVVFLATRTR